MKSVILETATEKCSVAVTDGNQLLSFVLAEAAHQHASHLTVYARQALRKAGLGLEDIEVVALGHGPGSFTGLRVGAAVAKGFCLARPQLKFLTVNSLLALTDQLRSSVGEQADEALYLPTVNSRRGEVYAQVYRASGETIGKLRSEALNEKAFPEIEEHVPIHVGGSGTNKVAELMVDDQRDFRFHPEIMATADILLPLVTQKIATEDFEDYASYEPLYLKPPFVTKSTKKLLSIENLLFMI